MPHTKRVFDAMERQIEWFRERAGNPGSLLYVGWRRDCKPWWYTTFAWGLRVNRIGILEIFPKNIGDIEQLVWSGRYSATIHQGDVREIEKVIKPGSYDVIFWDHGPEHVTQKDLDVTTPVLLSHANRLVIYCCPWGDWPQGIEDGNEHEAHRNSLNVDDLTKYGMQVASFGSIGQGGEGELLAFKFVKEHAWEKP